MKKVTFVLAAMLLLLSGCNGAPTAAVSSDTSSIASSENISSRASSQPNSELVSSDEASSEAPSSEVEMESLESSEAASSEPVSAPEPSTPVVSQTSAPVSSQVPQASAQSSKPAETAVSSELSPPVSSDAPPESVVEEPLRMTEEEADALIQEGIAYAESKGMTWYDDFSIAESGYNPPAYTEMSDCRSMLMYNINSVYNEAVNDSFYEEGNFIYYKIEKGRIDDFPGWFIYVLY